VSNLQVKCLFSPGEDTGHSVTAAREIRLGGCAGTADEPRREVQGNEENSAATCRFMI